MKVIKSQVRLHASERAVIQQFLQLPGKDRVKHVVNRVKGFNEEMVAFYLAKVMNDFGSRHRKFIDGLMEHFKKVSEQYEGDISWFSENRKLLLGAYFTKEYSIQSAALFNPSIVPHPDQSSLQSGELRFVISLRATGEGHISSVVFKTGIIDRNAQFTLDQEEHYYTPLKKRPGSIYKKEFIFGCIEYFPLFNKELLQLLPETFTVQEAISILKKHSGEADHISILILEEIFDTNYELQSDGKQHLAEKVLFPSSRTEIMGIEDVRFVRFARDDGSFCYYGTYTAYDGHQTKTQLIETTDFVVFKVRALYGNAITDKGMALFPEKINGKYAMIARQGGEMINIMYSDNLYCWDHYQLLMEPEYAWELVQLGNCGSPVKTEKGWLVLTHGVGPVRTYVISAVLLDLDDPGRIIARLEKPLIEADGSEREGYVPNVVYTCGLLKHGNSLLIPYAVSDSATGFVTVGLDELLHEMTYKL
jgi:predicted GH43/DUF377 family glycosyl hydrolase